jgi:hypothetical protein
MPPDVVPAPDRDEIFADAATLSEQLPLDRDTASDAGTVRGGRERGLVVHKLLEEMLTGETAEDAEALEIRTRALLAQLGISEAARPEDGPSCTRAGRDRPARPLATGHCRVQEPVSPGDDGLFGTS